MARVQRAEKHGRRGQGFTVEFLGTMAAAHMDEAILQGIVVIRGASIAAVVSSTEELKQKMRSFLDSHFVGSAMHSNNHRRVSNASVQSVTYDDISEKGQYGTLIYSKFGDSGPDGFIDYLLLHIRGGTVRARNGGWLRLTDDEDEDSSPSTNRFFVPSKDGKKLFHLERVGGAIAGKTRLLATLVKSLEIKPSLHGLEAIMLQRGTLFYHHFDQEWARRSEDTV